MTPEELNKKASLSDDAIDQANLKLALMQHDAQQKYQCCRASLVARCFSMRVRSANDIMASLAKLCC